MFDSLAIAPLLQLLLLVIVANGSPIILRDVLQSHLAMPVDFGRHFFDGYRWLGDSKTWRGIFGAIIVTVLAAMLLGLPAVTGALVALLAMAGDLLASFIKRRLRLPPSSMAPLLDQIPETLLPAVFLAKQFELNAAAIVILLVLFIVFELSISRLLYRLGIRKRPY